jgi:alpha-tubulin suppressor-like RCC1 family protein
MQFELRTALRRWTAALLVLGAPGVAAANANTAIPCAAKAKAVIANTGHSVHDARSTVNGDVQTASTAVRNGGTITGTLVQNTPAGLTAVPAPAGATNLGNFVLGSTQSRNLAPGNYVASSFTLNGNSTLTVSGLVQIWVSGALVIGGRANAGGVPENLEFIVGGTSDVHVNSGSSTASLVYAPRAQVFVDSTLRGSVVGTTVTLNSGGQVTFDAGSTCPMPPPPACTTDGDCGDNDACTADACVNAVCQHTKQASCVNVAVGFSQACSIRPDATLACWGNNSSGQLGNGSVDSRFHPNPATVPGLSGVSAVSAGRASVCAISNGNVFCWGNGSGTPSLVPGLTGAVAVTTAGENENPEDPAFCSFGHNLHACALLADGTVSCWGGNHCGELGDGTTVERATPATVPGLRGVVSLFAGGTHTCALLQDGSVSCWGGNQSGQLGNGNSDGLAHPTPATVAGLSGRVAALSGGNAHTCALLSAGGLECWGEDFLGETGYDLEPPPSSGGRPLEPSPVPTQGIAKAAGISAHDGLHTCALLPDATARCWGNDNGGELGNGTVTDLNTANPVPSAVLGLNGPVASIVAGDGMSCAVLADASVECWGDNSFGGVGNGTTDNGLYPLPVPVTF